MVWLCISLSIYMQFASMYPTCRMPLMVTCASRLPAAGIVSLISLAVLSYERYSTMMGPTEADSSNYRKISLGIAVSWVYSLVWTMPPLFGWSHYGPEGPGTTCSVNWTSKTANNISYIICLFVFCLLVPFLAIVFCYGKLLCAIRQVGDEGRRVTSTTPLTLDDYKYKKCAFNIVLAAQLRLRGVFIQQHAGRLTWDHSQTHHVYFYDRLWILFIIKNIWKKQCVKCITYQQYIVFSGSKWKRELKYYSSQQSAVGLWTRLLQLNLDFITFLWSSILMDVLLQN